MAVVCRESLLRYSCHPSTFSLRLAASVALFALVGVLPWLPAAEDTTAPAVIATLKGHSEAVYSLAFSPDGKHVVTGSGDHTIKVWDSAAGKEVKSFGGPSGHQNLVLSVAISPDGGLIASGGSDNKALIWDFPTSSPLRAIAKTDGARVLAASPDGTKLAGSGKDGHVKIWNSADDKELFELVGHRGPVAGLIFSGNGQLLVSCGEDKTLRFWNPAHGQSLGVVGAHPAEVRGLAVSPNNNAVYSAGADGTLKFWALPPVASKTLGTAHGDTVTALALSNDGNSLVSASADKSVRLTNTANGQLIRDFKGAAAGVESVALSPNGALIAAGTADKRLLVWQTKDGQLLANVASPATGLAFNPASNQLVTGGGDGTLKLWAMPPAPERTLAHPDAVRSAAVSADGKRLLTGCSDKQVRLWNLTSGQVERLFAGPTLGVLCVAMNPAGTQAAAGSADKTIFIWEMANDKEIKKFALAAAVNSMAFSPDGKSLAAGLADNSIHLFDLAASKEVKTFTGHSGAIKALSFTNKGDRLISAGDDKTIKIWNAADGKLVKSLDAHDGPVLGVAVNADATRLVSCGADKTVKIFTLPAKPDAKDEKPLVIKLPDAASAVALSPNGQHIAAAVAGAKSARIHVFDAVSGKELLVFAEHAGTIPSLGFLADNRTLVSAGADKIVRLSDMNILASFDAHAGGVTSVVFHANGTQALSAGADKTVKLWDLMKGQGVKTFGPLPDVVRAAVFNRAGTQIGAVYGKTAMVWNVADGKEVRKLEHPAEVAALSFSPDGTRLATGAADNEVHVWDLATGNELQAFLHSGSVRTVAYHPSNNALLISGSADKTIALHTLTVTRVLPAGTPLRAVAVTTNGSHVLTAGDDGKIKLWNAGSGANERTLEAGGKALHALAVSKNNVLLAAGGDDQTVRVFTLNDGKLLAEIKAPGIVRNLTFAPNSQALAATCTPKEGAGVLQTWNVVFNPGQPVPAEFGKSIQTYRDAGAVADVIFAGKGGIFYSGSADKPIQVWKLAADTPTKNFPHPNIVDAVAFSPDGTQLATGCHDGRLRLFDVAKGAQIRDIPAHVTMPQPSAIYCLAWSADGKQIVTGSYDRSLKLWSVADGKLIREFKGYEAKKFEKGHTDGVVFVALAPDGKTLASAGGWDHSIKIWNVADGNVIRELTNPSFKAGVAPQPPQAHPGVVYRVRYTPDGKRLISAGGAPRLQGYLAIWNVEDGKMLYGAEQSLGTLFSLAVSADGKYLAVGAGGASVGGEESNKNNGYVMKLPSK